MRGEFYVKGRVQGVCFRMYTCQHARQLGLNGFVRNLQDGRVHIVVEGPRTALEALAEWCRHGPPMADVRDVTEAYSAETGEFGSFDITF